jgi:hypothetical protein
MLSKFVILPNIWMFLDVTMLSDFSTGKLCVVDVTIDGNQVR